MKGQYFLPHKKRLGFYFWCAFATSFSAAVASISAATIVIPSALPSALPSTLPSPLPLPSQSPPPLPLPIESDSFLCHRHHCHRRFFAAIVSWLFLSLLSPPPLPLPPPSFLLLWLLIDCCLCNTLTTVVVYWGWRIWELCREICGQVVNLCGQPTNS